MKRMAIVAALVVLATAAWSQNKIGHINSEAIMQQLPEAQDAQRSLDQLVAGWEAELQKMQDEWKKKFDEYEKKKLILTDQARADQEKQLRDLDQAIVEFRNRKFGQNGELFQKQTEVMKPVQNKLFQVLEELAKGEEYDYIIDKSGEILLLYANDKNDLTTKVLQRMQTFRR
ncbi:MAG: OmpH family outer membrane protein [Bacteroidota bacterium]